MKTISQLKLSLFFILLLSISYGFAQDQQKPLIFRVETKDGNGYIGELLSSDSVRVRFKAENLGEITLLQKDIKTMVALEAGKENAEHDWKSNPQATRYFFSPNGYGLKKGEGYYQNIWVLVNSFSVGINDYVSVGGGMIPLFLFAGAPTPAWITLKVSLPVRKDQFNLGAGILAGSALGESETGFGIFYGIATLGSKDKNISLGAGYGFAGGSISNAPMINLSGLYRISARGYLLSENYLFSNGSESSLVMMIGGRQIIKEASLDYGLMIPVISGSGTFFAIPWLGITIPFGSKHLK